MSTYMDRVRAERTEKKLIIIVIVFFILAMSLGIYAGYKGGWTLCDDPAVCSAY